MWDKGYVIEEDEAIEQVVRNWEQKSNIDTKLSFYNSDEIAPKTLRASRAGTPPDVLFAAKSVYPISDWRDKLADVSDVVKPVEDRYTFDALQAAKVYGGEAEGRYYAVPLNQSISHIFYWKDLLQQAGYQPDDIPTDWNDFWDFWKTAQKRLRSQGLQIHSIGFPLSVGAKDSYHIFEHVLEAHNVLILNSQGQLLVDQPQVRQGIIQCLNWYVQLYRDGYIPPDAVNWLDPDNNRGLLNRTVLMTVNPTLSIPAAVRNDPTTYYKKLGSIEFPHKLNGQPFNHLVSVRQVIVFVDSPHQQAAKDFLSYLTQPSVSNEFLKHSYGRFQPATTQLKQDSFWSNPADPHISTTTKTLIDGTTRPYYNALNPAYGVVMEKNVWGQVLNQMAVKKISAEQAADSAIGQIKEIFNQW